MTESGGAWERPWACRWVGSRCGACSPGPYKGIIIAITGVCVEGLRSSEPVKALRLWGQVPEPLGGSGVVGFSGLGGELSGGGFRFQQVFSV